ncbi:MAG: carbon-nitrogen hydrolase family protein [Pirellulales bacterium]|nr:carbon-nitrogen hydrolase family protein [Pirellulales bacterium]
MPLVCVIALLQQGRAEEATVRIAMGQIVALDGDREGNFVRIEGAVEEAKGQGAQIVCLPETTILGWVNPEAHRRAYPVPGKDSDRLAALAKKYGVYLCAGLAEKDGEALHDTAVLIDPAGKILLKHRKINILTSWMTPPYTPGKDIGVAKTPFGTIGILICADTFRESICRRMQKLQPDLVLVPYGWAAREDKWPRHGLSLKKVVSGAAGWIGAPVVGTDLVGQISNGPERGRIYGGASVAVASDGTVLALAKDRDRDVKVFTVTLPRRTRAQLTTGASAPDE